ncbi:MAG: hydantoinase B/oxoprolinase family protein [Thermoleophilia bacterium]|nr:hydantoinase B/oxoprolinase family protein [Thermoleophilia bacterium]
MSTRPATKVDAPQVDPITFEVVRHKLGAINEEQALTIRSISGSSIVTDVADFNTGIFGPEGEVVSMGWHVGFKSGCMSGIIRGLIERYGESPGIRDGDMFVLNDPYFGALHQQDVAVITPIFQDGVRVGWTGSDCHEIDVGGIGFGGFHLGVHEIQQEGLLLPGVKLVENGRIRQDVWDMIMGMVRLPTMVALDLKAMIAANSVAARRLLELIDRYGSYTVAEVMRMEVEASNRRFRKRMRSLPDGVFRAVDFLEHDGNENRLFKIALSLEKRGDRVVVDMTGTSAQADGSINCAFNGLRGAVLSGIMPILAPDIRWNEGIFSAVKIVAPEGSLVNASRPAPVSGATIGAMFLANQAMQAAASRLAACLAETAPNACSLGKAGVVGIAVRGRNRDGTPFGDAIGDLLAGGGGAYVDHDGLDPGADFNIPLPVIGNVERYESAAPYLMLFRRRVTDSGGAGRTRGGVGIEYAVTPHDTDALHVPIVGSGMGVPVSGLMGGYEGCSNRLCYVDRRGHEGSPVGRVTGTESIADAGGEVHLLGPKTRAFPLVPGDVLACACQGVEGTEILWTATPSKCAWTSLGALCRSKERSGITAWS